MNSHFAKPVLIAAVIVLATLQTAFADDATMRLSFQWPEANPNAITDARLKELVKKNPRRVEKGSGYG